MSEDGRRTDCSDVFDFTGRYIWHENGKEEGRCCGIDFEQAGRKWRANQCSNANVDPVCRSAAISTFVPFAYDAGIALAHGLDKLLHRDGIDRDKITADMLIRAIRNSSFEGVSGNVSFLENGNRRPDNFTFVVYNYMRGFQAVGKILNGTFRPECEGGQCASTIFSDGSTQRPNSVVRDVHGYVCMLCAILCLLLDVCLALVGCSMLKLDCLIYVVPCLDARVSDTCIEKV